MNKIKKTVMELIDSGVEGIYREGEEEIAKYADFSYYYARDVLKGRFRRGEEVIKVALYWVVVDYAIDVIKGRWEEAEGVMDRKYDRWYEYENKYIKGV